MIDLDDISIEPRHIGFLAVFSAIYIITIMYIFRDRLGGLLI